MVCCMVHCWLGSPQTSSTRDSARLHHCQQPLVVSLQEQFGAALALVRQILERRPDHYVALAQLMSLLWRAGRIAEGEKHLQASLQKVVRGASSAGEQPRLSHWGRSLSSCGGVHSLLADCMACDVEVGRTSSTRGPPAHAMLDPTCAAVWHLQPSSVCCGHVFQCCCQV